MLLLLPWPAALAAPEAAQVAGVGDPHAVALLLQQGSSVAIAPCTDAAGGGDSADGIWTCAPLPPVSGEARVGLLTDGRLVDAGPVTLGEHLYLALDAGRVVVGDDAGLLPVPAPRTSTPALQTALARVTGVGSGPAPVLRLQAPAGSTELSCRDDGVFPDRTRNDGEHGCAGAVPGPRAEVYLNGGNGGTRAMGMIAADAGLPVVTLVVDAAAGTARAEAFELPSFAPAVVDAGTPPEVPPPTDVPLVPGPESTPPAPTPPPPGGTPTPHEEEAGRTPVASRPVSSGGALATIAAFVLGGAGAWAASARARRLPSSLRLVPAAPLLDGGPALTDPPLAIETPDAGALAGALVPALARHRRVVLIGPDDLALPPTPDGPVYRASGDCEEIEAAVRALARSPGPGVAVVAVGDGAASDPGAVVPDALGRLREGLPPGVWFAVIGASIPGFERWKADGPPWRFTRGTEASS